MKRLYYLLVGTFSGGRVTPKLMSEAHEAAARDSDERTRVEHGQRICARERANRVWDDVQ